MGKRWSGGEPKNFDTMIPMSLQRGHHGQGSAGEGGIEEGTLLDISFNCCVRPRAENFESFHRSPKNIEW